MPANEFDPVCKFGKELVSKYSMHLQSGKMVNLKTGYGINTEGVHPVREASARPTFEEIYRDHAGKILNLAFRMTGTEETARDLTQDIFLKVYQKLDTFRGDSQIYTWIHRIATNHIINYLKKNRRRQWLNLLNKPLGEVLSESRIDPFFWGKNVTAPPDKKIEKQEREEIIWKFIQSLPVKYRVPLVMHRYEGMSYQQIADLLEISLSALETRIHRAKKMLLKKLEPWKDSL